MIFDTPISWFINEIIASILFIICIVHISKEKNAIHRMLELFCYVLTAGIFENIGVWAGIYDYSVNRIMMFGKVPFAILFIEGVIVYFVMLLMERINVPCWALPFGAGVLASIQDMTLDPSSVFDIHNFSGSLEGQWNWVKYYEGGFVDIPFFNFSGWLTMVLFFMMCVQVGRYLYYKYQKEWIGYVYPFVSILVTVILLASPINQFLLYMVPFFKMNTKTAELFMLCFNYIVCFFIMFKFAKYDQPYDKKRDRLMFLIPIFLHIYALINSIVLGITKAMLPIIVVTLLHCTYLFFVYKKMKKVANK